MRRTGPLGPLLLCAGLGASPLAGQNGHVHVNHYTVDDGLAQNLVTGLAQDSAGFLWIGTSRGLQRFDGYSFVAYRALDPDAPVALSGHIVGLLIDQRNRLWVQTPTALYYGHGQLRRFDSSRNGTVWAPDSTGQLWVWDDNGARAIAWHQATPHVNSTLKPLPRCCAAVAAGRTALWVAAAGVPAGIWRIDRAHGSRQFHALPALKLVRVVRTDQYDRVWVGGVNGVAVLDAGARAFRVLPEFSGTDVGAMAVDNDGAMLIATARWLARVDAAGKIRERWTSREAFPEPMPARAIVIDHEGGFWLTTTTAGLVRLDPRPRIFTHLSSTSNPPLAMSSDFVMSVHEAADSALWIGTLGGGAYRLKQGPHLTAFRQDALTNQVWSIESDDAGSIWLATSRGLCRVNGTALQCEHMPAGEPGAVDLARDREGWIWFARGEGGIGSWHPSLRRFGGSFAAPGHTIAVMADTDSNMVWFGGSALYRARVARGVLLPPVQEVAAELSAYDQVFDIRRDFGGAVWLGTSRGLQRWDRERNRFVRIDVPELSGTTVFSIAPDPRGVLWLGTAHGLVQYATNAGTARRYRRSDGVMSGEFNRGAALRRASGEMIFGGVQGLTRFHPDLINTREQRPLVVTRAQKATGNGMVELGVDNTSALRLGPDDRSFTVDFAALTFAPGPARRYRYRLDGLSPNWIETTEHSVTYATPPPGRYRFQVQTVGGAEGAWAQPGTTLPLTVVPPLWRTPEFRGLMAILLLLGLWLLHRLRLRQVLETERLRMRISRDLHDEIGAGLSSIALLSDAVGMTNGMEARDRSHLERIGYSARAMVSDLRDIVWAIDPDGDRLQNVVSRMKDVAADLLYGIHVDFIQSPNAESTWKVGMAARRDLLLIYKELLHNIARHARATVVSIHLHVRGEHVVLEITDDGRGFDPAEVRSGTGLKSMRERAARIGARLEFAPAPRGGTRVRVTLKRRERVISA